MSALTSALTGLLNLSLRPSGRISRFMLDTYITPSVYIGLSSLLVNNPAVPFKDLEAALLPLMHPNHKHSVPLKVLENNLRFRAWVRNAYLRKCYANGSGSQSQSWWKNAERLMLNPETLPTYQQVVNLFDLQTWDRSRNADEDVERNNLLKVLAAESEAAGPNIAANDTITKATSTSAEWGMEQVLETMGCCVYGMNEFNVLCEQHGIYDTVTSDYVQALSGHLLESATRIRKSRARITGPLKDRPIVVLEIGAGSGRLSHFLRENVKDTRALQTTAENGRQKRGRRPAAVAEGALEGAQVFATDSGRWRIKREHEVKMIEYKEALALYNPDIVLCSWMPMGDDWTRELRVHPSVQEYILIGEVDEGCCGHPWLTWGNVPEAAEQMQTRSSVDLFDMMSRIGTHEPEVGPVLKTGEDGGAPVALHVQDGFERNDVPAASAFQLSRYDRKVCASNSRTTSFRRVKTIARKPNNKQK